MPRQASSRFQDCAIAEIHQWFHIFITKLQKSYREPWNRSSLNTLRPRKSGRRIADDTFKRIFLNETIIISIKISLKFVSKGPIENIPALLQIMTWRRPCEKPLPEPMTISLLTHICVTRPQWVKWLYRKLLVCSTFLRMSIHICT